jgi:predicted metal-dependent phosphoesterase TrpH
MDIGDGVADLHMHTTASDGTAEVEDRIQQATADGLDAIALTDHDTITDRLDQRVNHHDALEVITGVEIRADVVGTKVELLGYYIDPIDDDLTNLLERVRSYRRDRNQEIVARLHEETALDRSYRDIRSEADGILGRPHIADVLIEHEIVDSVGTAFQQYLGSTGSAFVPMERVSATEVIEVLRGAGGVVSLAHPGRIRTDTIEELLDELVAGGLDAIEVAYPYAEAPSEGYADVDVEDAGALADRFDLLQTGGSDCHGPGSGKYRLGNVRTTRPQLDAIRDLASERRSL